MSQTAAATNVVTLKTCVLKGFDYNNTDVGRTLLQEAANS
jgi:hypothetical protein